MSPTPWRQVSMIDSMLILKGFNDIISQDYSIGIKGKREERTVKLDFSRSFELCSMVLFESILRKFLNLTASSMNE